MLSITATYHGRCEKVMQVRARLKTKNVLLYFVIILHSDYGDQFKPKSHLIPIKRDIFTNVNSSLKGKRSPSENMYFLLVLNRILA